MADVYKKISEYNELAELDASGKMLVAQSDETYSVGADTMADFVKGRITMDSTPTQGSSNPVTSNGVYNAVSAVRTETQSAIQTVQSEVDALEVATTLDATLTSATQAAQAKAVGDAIDEVKNVIPVETSTGYTHWINASAMPVKSINIDSSATKLFRTGKNLSGGDAWLTVGGTIDLTNRTVSGTNSTDLPNFGLVCPIVYKEKTAYTIILTGKTSATHDSCGFKITYADGTSTELRGYGTDKATIKRTTDPNKTFTGIARITKSGRKYFYVDECGIFEGDISVGEFEAYQGEIYTVTDGETNKEVTTLQGYNAIWAYPESESTVEYYASLSQKWISDKFGDVDSALQGILYPNVVSLHSDSKAKATTFKTQRTTSEEYGNASLKLLYFTDVHNEIGRVGRAVELMNAWGSGYFDVAVNGGDTTSTIFDADQLAAYDAEIASSDIPVLNTVGNHDVYSTLDGARPLVNQVTAYNAITAKVKENVPAIVQPDGAATNGANYYYYDVGSIRIVVLDCMYWDSAEETWLQSVLADAITNSKAVMCVSHYNFVSTAVDNVAECAWNPTSYAVGGSSSYPMPIAAAQAVKTFQDNGGEFIIWLCGHSHGDSVKKLKSEYGDQFELICPSFVNRAGTVFKNTDPYAYNYDCLTYIVVDTYYKIVRGMRIGANINEEGSEYHTFSINYSTGEFLTSC